MARLYIQKIYDLVQSGEEFPVDLDEVWMMQYSSKDSAIRAMRNNGFRENIDYKSFQQSYWKPQGGRPGMCYKLSLSCFEYFIVRKIDWLFEIYRSTFHGVLSEQIKPIDFRNLIESARAFAEYAIKFAESEEKRIKALEEKTKALQKVEAFQSQF